MNKKEIPKYNSSVFFVKDVERSKQFYTEILGQKIEMDFGRFVGFVGGFAIWDIDYAREMMGLPKSKKRITITNNAELYFEIEDLDLLHDKIKAKNFEFVHAIKEPPWGQRSFRIYDPDNHIIEFGEPMSIVIQRYANQGLTESEIVKKTMMPLEMVQQEVGMIKSKSSEGFSGELIAPCGMNCRLCIGFFGYTMNGKKRKGKCVGCRPRDKGCAFLKKHCKKIAKSEIDFCYKCTDFPCQHLQKLDKYYIDRYDMSMIKNLEFIEEKGMEKFLQQQQETYKCTDCGNVICVHNGKCYNCDIQNK